ncbi:MAG: rRNA pseudouridine synthase [Bacteroidetes bacterium]|nr:rRNA pseudouridine synthase [Bacteroidota bacterium]
MGSLTNKYFLLNKPVNMVSQFVSPHKVPLLADLNYQFPKDIHAIGRLDSNSEGLLLLTTNKNITRLLFSSKQPHKRVYLVQVNKAVSEENLFRLRNGVSIKVKEGQYYITPACDVQICKDPSTFFSIIPTGNYYGVHTWLLITLYEGKFRQVRKMMYAINHRCKRLIRISIEDLNVKGILPGEIKEISEDEFFSKLHLENDCN